MSEWISIKDRLPVGHREVLLSDGQIVRPGYYRDTASKQARKWRLGSYATNRVTHWMPLPAPPKEDTY